MELNALLRSAYQNCLEDCKKRWHILGGDKKIFYNCLQFAGTFLSQGILAKKVYKLRKMCPLFHVKRYNWLLLLATIDLYQEKTQTVINELHFSSSVSTGK